MEQDKKLQPPMTPRGSRTISRFSNLNLDDPLGQGDFQAPSALDKARIQQAIEKQLIDSIREDKSFQLTNVLELFQDGFQNIVKDDFSKCFAENRKEPWNWNFYLYVLWACGVVVRNLILFPLRCISLFVGFCLHCGFFALLQLLYSKTDPRKAALERKNIAFLSAAFVFSWTGVIRYHGVIPARATNRIYVANHTSMIDPIVLLQKHTFSMVGQKHPGFVGFMQNKLLACLVNSLDFTLMSFY